MDGTGSWALAILDEIALEGLEGVTLPSLWILLSVRLEQPLPLSEYLQKEFWLFILRCYPKLKFYILPKERAVLKLYNRFEQIDDQMGVSLSPNVCPYQRYKFAPVQDGPIFGSCEHYSTRQEVQITELRTLNLDEVLTTYGSNKLVIVASQDLRFDSLTPRNVQRPKELTASQYAIWETIGRARYNGETTSGPWSIQNLCKDSSIVFYVKSKLTRLNVLAHQPFNEKRNDRYTLTTLLTLPRFFKARKCHLQSLCETLFQKIKESPEQRVTTIEARDALNELVTSKSLKKMMLTHIFRRIFVTSNVPYVEIDKNSKAKNRKAIVITVRDQNFTFDQLMQADDNELKDDKPSEFLNDKHSFTDMPLEDECYRAVERHGIQGISMPEVTYYLGLNYLTVRTILKYLERENLIKKYNEHVGRQRVVRYVATIQSQHVSTDQEDTILSLQNLRCRSEPKLPESLEVVLTDIPVISANISHMKRQYKPVNQEKMSTRQAKRQATIIRLIDEKCIIQFSDIRFAISEEEKSKGYTEEICRKSIFRLIQSLCNNEIINCYEITLKYQDTLRLHRFVTHPKIQIDHELLQREIIRLKNNLYIGVEERVIKPTLKKRPKITFRGPSSKISGKVFIPKCRTKPPKLFAARELHHFLFYILMELHVEQTPLEMSEELLFQWQLTEPELRPREYFEEWSKEEFRPYPYSDEINWRTFIPPLPRYEDKPAGWLNFLDAVERMPLSVFNKLFRIESDEYIISHLKHPVRQHYLMGQLPAEVRCITTRVRLQTLYMNSLRLLNNMGLVQVTDRQNVRDPLQIWVYLNRHTRILDTTTSEPGYEQINPAREYKCIKYEFTSREDIEQYWTFLQTTCIFTKLGFTSKRNKTKNTKSYKCLNFVRTVNFEEAQQYDNGEVPGDQLGAAGLSSTLYAYQFRHWSWVVSTEQKVTYKRKVHKQTDAKIQRQPRLIIGRKARSNILSVKRDSHMRKKKGGPRDDIDRDALKNMRNLRVTWSKEEDRILKMARAVFHFLSPPITTMGLMHVGRVCRDVIRSYLGICNKTTQSCVRRLQFLSRTKRDQPDIHTWLYMLQINNHIINIYNEEFLEQLKIEYPSKAEYSEAVILHFLIILNTLNKLINTTNAVVRNSFLLPDNVKDYEHYFNEYDPINTSDVIYHKNPTCEYDLRVSIAQCVLHSTLCSVRDKTLYNLQAFEIYKHFSENVLSDAFSKSRKESLMIAIKRRNLQITNRQISGPSFFLSSKYIYKLHYLKIPHTVIDKYYDYQQNSLIKFYGTVHNVSSATMLKDNCLELKSPHFAQLLYIGECLANHYVHLDIKLPVNILTVDTSKQKVSQTDRILYHYSSLFANRPQTEYAKQIESETEAPKLHIKFHPANLSYKVSYSPYDYISKLQSRYLHFFCALDHLGHTVDINFSNLQRKDESGNLVLKCPFNCILNNQNYLNVIERVVLENKAALRILSDEMPPQKLLNQMNNGNNITVHPTNLMTLVRMLETFWQEKETSLDCKDFGRLSANLYSNKKVMNMEELCAEICDYNPDKLEEQEHDKEYEPTMNKEERARAQDVLVINLPTIQMKMNEQLPQDMATINYNSQVIQVPKIMIECRMKEEAILTKVSRETYWKYTDNSFETLQPLLDKLNYNQRDRERIESLLKFIEAHELGVEIKELKNNYPLDIFLNNALHLLADHYLIKRVGISSFMYVHKNYIRDWVVHTFHIKRLQREKLTESSTETLSRKRKQCSLLAVTNEDAPTTSKKARLENIDINVENVNENSEKGKTLLSEVARDVIVMRPQPWMRVNGSINRRVLDRWLNTILSECISQIGCHVCYLFTRFPHMLPVDIMFLLEILCDLNCVHLVEMQTPLLTLDSVYNPMEFIETVVTELYDPTVTYIVAHHDAVGRLCNFIGQKKYNIEFV